MPDAKRRSSARRKTRVALLVWLVSLLVAAAFLLSGATGFVGTALAAAGIANLRGKVSGWDKLLPAMYVEASKPEAHRYTWREPSPTVKQDFRRLSANASRDVCVVALAAGAASAHEPQAVKVTGGRISPATIVLSPGSRLSFRNADPFPHQLYEVGNAGWAPNPTAPGSTREWAATNGGVHQIRDLSFPSIVMYVVVDERAVDFAFPDKEGQFVLNVPPGDYTVKAFFDGKQAGRPLEGVHVGERSTDLKDPLVLAGGESK